MAEGTNGALAAAGAACWVAAIVGGGVSIAGNEIPVLDNVVVQGALVIIGSVLLWGSEGLPGAAAGSIGVFLLVVVGAVAVGIGDNAGDSPRSTATASPTSTSRVSGGDALPDSTSPVPKPNPTVVPDSSVCDDLSVSVVRIESLGSIPTAGDVWGVTVSLSNGSGKTAELPPVDSVVFISSSGAVIQPLSPPPPQFGDPWFFPIDLPAGTSLEKVVLVGAGAPDIVDIAINDIGDGQPFSSCTATN